jgi:hypothetical protein
MFLDLVIKNGVPVASSVGVVASSVGVVQSLYQSISPRMPAKSMSLEWTRMERRDGLGKR